MAAGDGIIVLALPPHLTHYLQPLDLSIFDPLKLYWLQVCHTYIQKDPGRVVTKYQFCSLFSEMQAVRPQNVISGFCKAGIFPFDRHVVSTVESSKAS